MVRFVVYPICGDYEAFPPLTALDTLGRQLFEPLCNGRLSVKQTTENGGCLCDCRDAAVSKNKLRKRRSSALDSDEVVVATGSDSVFAVACNVRGYKPEEISVKTVENHVVISGRHEEERDDGSYVNREFTRCFTLPEGVDSDSLRCRLLASGVLSIEAPKVAPPSKKLRVIPISVESAPSSQVWGGKDNGED